MTRNKKGLGGIGLLKKKKINVLWLDLSESDGVINLWHMVLCIRKISPFFKVYNYKLTQKYS